MIPVQVIVPEVAAYLAPGCANDLDLAAAVVAAVAHRHTIESTVKVYLTLGAKGWEVAESCMEGELDSALFPNGDDCGCGPEYADEHEALVDAAYWLPMPTLEDLARAWFPNGAPR